MTTGHVAGLVLAAGAGLRMGAPKALLHDRSGVPWVVRTTRVVADGGCWPVVVVVGADAEKVRSALAGEPVEVVEAADWAEGMSASLRAGLLRLSGERGVTSVVIVPVDLPGLVPDAVLRVAEDPDPSSLARATFRGAPGHPVLIGRDHWEGVIATASGDYGARGYLVQVPPLEVECADLFDGADVDVPEALPPGHRPPQS
jgi:nicotine blue oxidoreductase